jgi:hypothetical protein
MLAKALCMKLAEEGMPTIIVNTAYHGDSFNKFIQNIEQPAAVFFDEFEKTYRGDDESGPGATQEALLTLLDGTYVTKKLFILTCNDKFRINDHMKNRPGRIYYMLEFKGLTRAFIEEYCRENLRSSLLQYTEKLMSLGGSFANFNFDMLKAAVEEMNRYCEEPKDALMMLNIKPDGFNRSRYTVRIFKPDNSEVEQDLLINKMIVADPQADYFELRLGYKLPKKESEPELKGTALHRALMTHDSGEGYCGISLDREDFIGVNAESRALMYRDSHSKHTVWLTKVEMPSYETVHPYATL